ncbi:MAG: hypothetical protein JSW38_11090 [Dehalococcoidia bacterium]|nr:MAG: hypothetical protein JSW38_11090 [Dehalococcoidia bacterium]
MFRSEKGAAMVYVTIVLVLTMLIIPPVLGFLGGAGRSAQIREDRMLAVYAADAGIEDGYYRIISGNISETSWSVGTINGSDVNVSIQLDSNSIYKIVSTATSHLGGNVTIESYAAGLDYSYLLRNALTSYGDISLKSGVVINGNVTLNEELDNKGDIQGNTTWGINAWPGVPELVSYYMSQVDTGDPYPLSYIDLEQNETMGPLYRQGTLDIYASGTGLTLTMDDPPGEEVFGTFFGTDAMDIGKTGQDFRIDMNNQTIFCAMESESENDYAIDMGGKVTLTGSGCIIAVGHVYFAPKVDMDPDDFIFVMSIIGDLTAQPQGEFTGAMAGAIEVQYQPGSTITWSENSGGLNFPDGDVLPGIKSYIIRN